MFILSCNEAPITLLVTITRRLLELIQISVPILLIIMIVVDLLKLVTNPDTKNSHKKIINKVIPTIVIFMIPVLLDATLGLLPNQTSFIGCWNEIRVSNNIIPEVEYMPIDNSKKQTPIINDPSDYQSGETNTNSNNKNTKNNSSNTKTKKTGVTGEDIIAYAELFNGKPYKAGGSWNGEFPYTSTDCVGFVRGVYKHFGIKIPTNASKLFTTPKKFTVVTGQPLKAGDIVVYNHHRALATGQGNRLIHAMGVKYGIGHSKNYKSCGAGPVRGVVRVNALSD